jgi:hypothetical protein
MVVDIPDHHRHQEEEEGEVGKKRSYGNTER